MKDFIYADNWFYNKYFLKLEKGHRYWTMYTAISLFLQMGGEIIVETGCARLRDDWGAGMSTLVFADIAENYDKEFWSIDISEENLDLSMQIIQEEIHPTTTKLFAKVEDSITALKMFEKPIDLLYLDSLDFDFHNPDPAQDHCLAELEAAFPLLSKHAVVLMDDNWLPGGGKPAKAKEWLREKGWTCIMDHHQSLWMEEL